MSQTHSKVLQVFNLRALAICASLCLIACGQPNTKTETKPVAGNAAVVNGKAIPLSQIDAVLKNIPQAKDDKETREKIKEVLINRELFIQEATKNKLSEKTEVKFQLDEAKNGILFAAVLDDYISKNVSEAELKTAYEAFIKQNAGTEYKSRHILVKTKAEADAILKQLSEGKVFDVLAKEKSLDKGSAEKGGDLDWAKPDLFVPEFAKALSAMKKGEKSSVPVQSPYGFHILQLDDVREQPAPKIEDIKTQLIDSIKADQNYQQQKLEELQKKLRSQAKIQ